MPLINYTKIMFNYFKKIFSHKEEKNNAQLSIVLDKNSEHPLLQIFIYDLSDHNANQMASLLIELNSGLYFQNMMDTLVNMSKDDKDIENFVRNVFAYMKIINKSYVDYETQNDPIVTPSSFYNRLSQ